MRILQILPSVESTSGGPVRSTLANCRAVHGVDPQTRTVLVTTDYGLGPDWRATIEGQLPEGMDLEVFGQVGRHTANFSPSLLRWLWHHANEFDVGVVRALFHTLSSCAAQVLQARGLPYVVVPHGTLSSYTFTHRRRTLKKAWWRFVDRRTVANAKLIRFTTKSEAEDACRLDIQTEYRIIPHPFESVGALSACALKPKEATPIVLFLSRLDPKKGLGTLLPAFADVRKESPEARLVVAGSGDPRFEQALLDQARGLGIYDSVEFTGFVEGDKKCRLFREATVFVLPSCDENFGIAAVEAAAAGLPVVVTRGVGIWSDLEQAGAGIAVDTGPKPIARAILSLLCDRFRCARMGEAGINLVRRKYAPEVVGPQVFDLYRTAAGITE